MKQRLWSKLLMVLLLYLCSTTFSFVNAQVSKYDNFKKASRKIEKGFNKNNSDTLAQGYFDLGENYYQKNELVKSETYYLKSKNLYQKINDADGIAKSSRALAKVQEALNKNVEAIGNYTIAQQNNLKTGNDIFSTLNTNDITRLSKPDSFNLQQKVLQENINLGIKNNDSNEVVTNSTKMAEISLLQNGTNTALGAYSDAYRFSKNIPAQALRYNQLITDIYLKDKSYNKAIAYKKEVLAETFVQSSTQINASEITSLAQIYILKKEDSTATRLLYESYSISVKNGHTLEAKKCIEKLDSIFQKGGHKEMSLQLYKNFLAQLPGIIVKDSSLTDNKIIEETESKLKKLETEKILKDKLIKEKNIINYWLIGFVIILATFISVILYMLKKMQIKNKKIALQSLRREMNPHFIFNSLNSINQFIVSKNEVEANQYLTKFSTLMRRVMENSKDDFVSFSKETELLQNYLELEQSRFSDKFNFKINIDDALYAAEQLYIPGMLVQPHIENAIWHGLRYKGEKGFLELSFIKRQNDIEITIEDNGIGIAESKKNKTTHQNTHNGRGLTNTLERIKILNQLYHHNITCVVQDKPAPAHGVKIKIRVPLLKNNKYDH